MYSPLVLETLLLNLKRGRSVVVVVVVVEVFEMDMGTSSVMSSRGPLIWTWCSLLTLLSATLKIIFML